MRAQTYGGVMNIGELHAALGAVINGNPKANNLDCFVSIDFGDGKKSRIYEIDEIYGLRDDAQVLIVKAWKQ